MIKNFFISIPINTSALKIFQYIIGDCIVFFCFHLSFGIYLFFFFYFLLINIFPVSKFLLEFHLKFLNFKFISKFKISLYFFNIYIYIYMCVCVCVCVCV